MAKKTKPKTPTKVKKTQVSETKIKKKQALISNDLNNANLDRDFIRSKSTALQEDVQINPPIKKNIAAPDNIELSVTAILQGALYVAGKEGMSIIELHKILPKTSTDEIKRHLMIMQNKYDQDGNMGICLKEFGGRYKMLTKSQIKKEMQRFVNTRFKNPLNSKLMEVLAIIAYNQPCTRPRISEIRGTDSAPLVDNLLEKGLIVELGRADTWGRPFIYEVSEKFYDLFGISDVKELPEVQNFDADAFSDASFFDNNHFDDN